MIAILASASDLEAAALAERWQTDGARLLMPRDLSLAGWQHRPNGPAAEERAVIGGEVVPTGEIRAVYTRLAGVWGNELAEIDLDDREYAGVEMFAFLLSWLSSLECPVCNRPTAASLMGPGWSMGRWRRAAAQVGLRAAPLHASTLTPAPPNPFIADPPLSAVTVIGTQVFGSASDALREGSLRLASLACVDVLVALFDSPHPNGQFIGAHFYPNLADPHIAGALRAHLLATNAVKEK